MVTPFDTCECGAAGFARFSVKVEFVGPRPDWMPNNDRSSTVCIKCARRAAGLVDEVAEALEPVEAKLTGAAGPEIGAEPAPAGPKLAAVLADEEGRAILPSHRPLLLAVERIEGGIVVRIARRAYDDPGAWGCVLADIVRDVAKGSAGPGLLKHGESMTAPQRRAAVQMLEHFRIELLETEQLDPGDPGQQPRPRGV